MITANDTGITPATATRSPDAGTWGTGTYFARVTGVDLDTAAYWLLTVYRPAHRVGHPKLNIDGCPGCTFEQAVS